MYCHDNRSVPLKVDVGIRSEFLKSMTQCPNQYGMKRTVCRPHRKEKIVGHHAHL